MALRLPRWVNRKTLFLTAIASSTLWLSACSNMIYKVTGDTMISFGQDKMIPYLLSTDDTQIGCVSGEALTPLMLSFGTVTTPPDKLAVLIHMVDGGCAMQRAADLELEFNRYTKTQQVNAARDTRIQSKRWYAIAAQRFLKANQALTRSMGELGGECPRFSSQQDQLVWLLGAVASLQAVMADGASGSQINVPKNIAPKAERAAACLDNDAGNQQWWALPSAIRATLWTVVPGLQPANIDPWKKMNTAMAMGEQQGVRLAHALATIAAYNSSSMALTKDIISRYSRAIKRIASNPDYQLVDKIGHDLILTVSDKLWMDAKGHRTPIGQLGHFWDDRPAATNVDVNIDDLF